MASTGNASVTAPKKRGSAGLFCIAPGCTNSFYKGKGVHFHRLPLKDEKLLKAWVIALKRSDPPLNKSARVCSDHFVKEDYIHKMKLDEEIGRMVHCKTADLMPGSVPSVFDLSGYEVGSTDRPSKTNTKSAAGRQHRAEKWAQMADLREVQEAIQKSLSSSHVDDLNVPDEGPLATSECCTVPCKPQTTSIAIQTDPVQSCHCQTVQKVSTSTVTNDIASKELLLHDHSYFKLDKIHDPDHEAQQSTKTVTVQRSIPMETSFDTDTSGDEESTSEAETVSSDFVPSSDCGSSSFDTSMEADEGEDLVMDRKYIVTSQQLKDVFKICHWNGCGKCLVQSAKFSVKGFGLTVNTQCLDGHQYTWHSQPIINGTMACNLLVPAAVFLTGNSCATFLEMCNCLGLESLSNRHWYNMQKAFIVPEVKHMWTMHNEGVMAALHGQELIVSGDARCDSPGHNASFGTYTLLDTSSRLIVAQETVKVTEVKNSYWMEPVGLDRCLHKLADHNVTLSILATDCHMTIQKMMRTDFPKIKREYDLWHIVKNVKKRLLKTKCPELVEWTRMVANHLWYCVCTCEGDIIALKEKWTSVLYHIINVHEWVSAERVTKCDHPPYTKETERNRPWLDKNSKAFEILQKVVLDKSLLKKLEKVTEGIHTGELECIHSLYTKYVPKRKKFAQGSFEARLHLAALDHNDSINREQAQTMKGKFQFKLQYFKAAKDYVVKPIKVGKTYDFRYEIMTGILNRCYTSSSTRAALKKHKSDGQSLVTLGQHKGAVKPTKDQAVSKHLSRFVRK